MGGEEQPVEAPRPPQNGHREAPPKMPLNKSQEASTLHPRSSKLHPKRLQEAPDEVTQHVPQ
eukprot:7145283-Pyramimonas_sp.AAC.1